MSRQIPSNLKLEKLFKNSTWIVPTETLLAYLTINEVSKAVSDQTVWIIDSYKDGYIFGTSYTTLDKNPTAKSKIVGSIASDGSVLFAFNNGNTIINGYGRFVKIDCQWQFIMQMNNLNSIADGVVGLSHWSYMVNVNKSDYDYQHLPGVGLSVPEFISLFN